MSHDPYVELKVECIIKNLISLALLVKPSLWSFAANIWSLYNQYLVLTKHCACVSFNPSLTSFNTCFILSPKMDGAHFCFQIFLDTCSSTIMLKAT